MDKQNNQKNYIDKVNKILSTLDFNRLDCSCNSSYDGYARSILQTLHKAFLSVYRTDDLEHGGYGFVELPAVIRGRDTGHIALGLVTLDLNSSGEHFGTFFFTPHGVIDPCGEASTEQQKAYIRKTFIPYDYWYTPKVENDIHMEHTSVPPDVKTLLDACTMRGPEPEAHLKME